jgi:hypothetical protein
VSAKTGLGEAEKTVILLERRIETVKIMEANPVAHKIASAFLNIG